MSQPIEITRTDHTAEGLRAFLLQPVTRRTSYRIPPNRAYTLVSPNEGIREIRTGRTVRAYESERYRGTGG